MDDLALPGRDDGLQPEGYGDLNGSNLRSSTEQPAQATAQAGFLLSRRPWGEEKFLREHDV